MTTTTHAAAPAAVRGFGCSRCDAAPGLPCTTAGDHLQRWIDAYSFGLVTKADMAEVFRAVLVITRYAVVPAGVLA